VFGNQSFARVQQALTTRGQYVNTVPNARILIDSLRTLLKQKRAHLVIVKSRARDLGTICEWVEAGKLRAIVHGVFALDQAVEAQQQIESKHTRGKVIVVV